MTDIDELFNSPPDPEKIARGARIYREVTGENPYAGLHGDDSPPRVQWGPNEHMREFDKLNFYRIRYAGATLQLRDIPREYRDEVTNQPSNFMLRMRRDYISLNGSIPPALSEPQQIIIRSDNSSDFPSLTANVMTSETIDGFNDAPETWPHFVQYLPARDYKQMDVIAGASLSTPGEVEEGAELPIGHLFDDGKESDRVRSHVQRITYSRQAEISGDVTALTQLARQAGIAAARAVGDSVYTDVLIGNPDLSDSVALFHADHGNLDGTAAAPSVSELDTAIGLMAAQQNGSGAYLNYRPRYLIVPPAKASTAAVIRASMNGGAVDGVDDVISVLVDSRLSGSTAWFTSAAKQFGGIVVAVLSGTEGRPRLERLTKAPVGAPDGLHFRVGYDFVVIPANYKALTKNPGA